jgi:diguanylate cyclase (GGDEF)-like protein
MSKQSRMDSQLAALEAKFRERLSNELADMATLGAQLQSSSRAEPQLVTDLRDRLHKLAGSAGTFGYTELGSRCRELEQQAQSQLERDMSDHKALDALAIATQHLHMLLQRSTPAPQQTQTLSTALRRDTDGRHIGLLIEEQPLAQQMSKTLTSFGYQVSLYRSQAQLANDQKLDALIVDTSPSGYNMLLQSPFPERDGTAPPLLIISSQDNFISRLQAVRAGACGFFTKPVDLPSLESRLERSFNTNSGGPFRVLIIDDDAELAARYQLVLGNNGMLVDTASDPNLLLDKMHSFMPDVVLMDISMPDYSGPELAQVIRLNDDWLRVPIVYLSAETNAKRQMNALLKAGDDFITKPISDNALLTTVYARAQRARMVSEALSRDSLTGLLKHADIKEQVDIEIERARRSKQPMAVAMIDIDHFKSVNDQYGHAFGDNVIRALSNLLRQRLRKVDRLGRYGGEEFVAVLPNCNTIDAWLILEEIREAFNALQFSTDQQSFCCSFSAGISGCEEPEWDCEELLDKADRQLYRAKHAGRNRICSDTKVASDD